MPAFRCFRTGATCSDYIEVPVPADVLWKTVADLEALPAVISMVKSFERISGSLPPRVGTKFREIRVHKGKEYTMLKTVTRLEEQDPQERSLSLGIATKNRNGWDINVVNTSTLIVKPIDEKTSCLLLVVAFKWQNAIDILNDLLCRPCLNRMVQVAMEEELLDYRNAAIARYAPSA